MFEVCRSVFLFVLQEKWLDVGDLYVALWTFKVTWEKVKNKILQEGKVLKKINPFCPITREVSLKTLPNVNIRHPSHDKNLPVNYVNYMRYCFTISYIVYCLPFHRQVWLDQQRLNLWWFQCVHYQTCLHKNSIVDKEKSYS